jgi:hypothetical protein
MAVILELFMIGNKKCKGRKILFLGILDAYLTSDVSMAVILELFMIGNLKGQREENLFLGIWDWDCQKFP